MKGRRINLATESIYLFCALPVSYWSGLNLSMLHAFSSIPLPPSFLRQPSQPPPTRTLLPFPPRPVSGSITSFAAGSSRRRPKPLHADRLQKRKCRDIVKAMDASSRAGVVSHGPRTGSAEDFGSRLAGGGKGRFGRGIVVADLED